MDEHYAKLLACFGDERTLAAWLLNFVPRWRQALHQALEPSAMRENELRILLALARQETSFGQQALGLSLCLDASTLARSLRRLEADGLVVREADAQDRRALWVSLTAPGRVLADQLLEALPSVLPQAWNKGAFAPSEKTADLP